MYSNQEEVDTRILLHCKYINTSSEKIVISCSDRDIFVISLYFCMGIPTKLYFHRCKVYIQYSCTLPDIPAFGKDVCDALIGFHCISGCDTVSSFHGIGKKKAFATMKSNKKYQVALSITWWWIFYIIRYFKRSRNLWLWAVWTKRLSKCYWSSCKNVLGWKAWWLMSAS